MAASCLAQFKAKKYAINIVTLLDDRTEVSGEIPVWFAQYALVKLPVRYFALHALSDLGAKEYAENIAELMKDDDVRISDLATQILEDWRIDPMTLKETKPSKADVVSP